jgi:hypothetical protein
MRCWPSWAQAHPDLPDKPRKSTSRATATPWRCRCPANGTRRLRPVVSPPGGVLRFAHSDWSGYSVFEEAFTRGHLAGMARSGA